MYKYLVTHQCYKIKPEVREIKSEVLRFLRGLYALPVAAPYDSEYDYRMTL